MNQVILILQILTGVVLAFLILVQVKGTGFGRVWGATSASFTRRGLEKLTFKLTFVVVFLFLVLSFLLFLA